ncbi:MAG TPA: hypothetical protein VJ901_21510 [Thermoanaerobaculia bacterium]|nr:hypothetical protein [Thermoanaerobaculia bacterium]
MKTRPFLPLFFVALGVILAGAIVWRVRAYTPDHVRSTINAPGEVDPATVGGTQQGRNGGSDAQQPIATDGGTAAVVSRTAITNTQTGASPQQPRPGMTLREQRFAEALAAAQKASAEQPPKIAVKPPAAAPVVAPPPPPKPAEKQGVLSRIGDAISNAFKGSTSTSASAQPQQNPNPSQRHDSPREKDAPETKREKDASSDTTPPQLMSLVFNPPSISDGAETMLVITAQDNLSGIRNISGSVASPTGKALQGFAAQREAPESNRYLARIVVPKDAEQGFWKVNFLSLTDNAGNTTNINSANGGGYGFTVNSARPDSTPPTLTAVWVDRRSMNAGEKNTIFVRATDDKSGVALVSGVFQSPAKTARIGFGCRMAAPDQFECDLMAPNPVDCGEWQLEQIQMQDKAQNMATYRGDNPLVAALKINIMPVGADHCDSTPPTVESLTLDPTDVSNAQDSVVTATAVVTDDTAVQSVSLQLAGPPADNGQPPRFFFGFQKTDQPNIWTSKMTIPKVAAKGTWSVVWLSAIDKSNNTKNYSQADPVLQNAKITVH